jgi:hypothetical protein
VDADGKTQVQLLFFVIDEEDREDFVRTIRFVSSAILFNSSSRSRIDVICC